LPSKLEKRCEVASLPEEKRSRKIPKKNSVLEPQIADQPKTEVYADFHADLARRDVIPFPNSVLGAPSNDPNFSVNEQEVPRMNAIDASPGGNNSFSGSFVIGSGTEDSAPLSPLREFLRPENNNPTLNNCTHDLAAILTEVSISDSQSTWTENDSEGSTREDTSTITPHPIRPLPVTPDGTYGAITGYADESRKEPHPVPRSLDEPLESFSDSTNSSSSNSGSSSPESATSSGTGSDSSVATDTNSCKNVSQSLGRRGVNLGFFLAIAFSVIFGLLIYFEPWR